MQIRSTVLSTLLGCLLVMGGTTALADHHETQQVTLTEPYDLVIAGGRVMDPETGLGAVRNIGIRGDRIAEISEGPLQGRMAIDAHGLVVAPGFIDLHAHGQTNAANEYQARDGVTTALELEGGAPFLRQWLASREGKALINYGATASHFMGRALTMPAFSAPIRRYEQQLAAAGADEEPVADLFESAGASAYEAVADGAFVKLDAALVKELEAGALGIGLLVGYQPGASWQEILHLFEFAAAHDTPIYVHVRDPGVRGIQEMIANAAATGATAHVVHVNSMALGDIEHALDLIEGAQTRGIDVTTEMYPYTAASTYLESSLFDGDWQGRLSIGFGDLQWQDTGERLTADTFARYREQGGVVIIHMMKERWIEAGIARPSTIIASDGMPYAPGAHPRSAGTFSRVLGRYVRERGSLDLMSALAKMTLLPAQRLERMAPAARGKGRLQVGADADITVFDPATVIDTATFEGGLSFSQGIEHVIVNGVPVVSSGESVQGVMPGRPLLGRLRR
ncbi:MAG: amidohydrolase family protein [Pseudomonadota bacterium]